MKIVCISDTHRYHAQVDKVHADVVVHAGDVCGHGSVNELKSFIEWYKDYPCTHKIFVAGNHDRCLETQLNLEDDIRAAGIIYLKDSSVVIDGIEFYGTPYQPFFCNWAFNVRDVFQLREIYRQIPESTDFLITHCPPYGVMDVCRDGSVGSSELQIELRRVSPKYHLFGHIHEAHGRIDIDGTTYINACQCDEHYDITNQPITVEI